jgi:predicted DCC family thiol-disulfide oxidoreductase YuxK
MITVFFDGKCSLCSAEIGHYKNIAPEDVFTWVDVTESPDRLNRLGISQVEALKSLHVQDQHGQLFSGVDAFAVLWRAIPRWKVLGIVVKSPGVYQIAKILYRKFADRRFKRLSHCQALVS